MTRNVYAIEKDSLFQGKTNEWVNVYTIESSASSASEYEAIIDALIAAERVVHATNVHFNGARVYTYEGLNGVLDFGEMKHTVTRDLLGTAAMHGPIYKETAMLVQWPLPKKSFSSIITRRKRTLKKWLHTNTLLATSGTDIWTGQQELATAAKNLLITYANTVENPVVGAQLVAPDGTEPNGNPYVHPFLEHRQFHQGPKFDLD